MRSTSVVNAIDLAADVTIGLLSTLLSSCQLLAIVDVTVGLLLALLVILSATSWTLLLPTLRSDSCLSPLGALAVALGDLSTLRPCTYCLLSTLRSTLDETLLLSMLRSALLLLA